MTRNEYVKAWKIALLVVVVVLVFGLLSFGGCAGLKGFKRAQKRADANNEVKVTAIYVQRQKEEAKRVKARDGVVAAQAGQRVIEARGIAEAQRLIAGSLTPLYVQHEAIEAQKTSQSERVYIPVGPQGVPLVADVDDDRIGGRP